MLIFTFSLLRFLCECAIEIGETIKLQEGFYYYLWQSRR